MLSVRDLSVDYGPVPALRGVSLDVAAGEILVVAGMNGAGKSSLVRAIAGLERPAGGRLLLDGRDITGAPLHRLPETALVPEGRILAPSLTVAETLRLGVRGAPRRTVEARTADALRRFPALAGRLRQRAGTLSGGEATMLALARALMGAPRLLLLDEPALGLSPAATKEVFGVIAGLRAEGLAILLVDQNVDTTARLADRLLMLRQGRVTDTPASRLHRKTMEDSPCGSPNALLP